MKKPLTGRRRRAVIAIKQAMLPIMMFAVVTAIMCWTAAWFFSDRVVFSDALIGLGCLPIVVAVCAYLLVLVSHVDRR